MELNIEKLGSVFILLPHYSLHTFGTVQVLFMSVQFSKFYFVINTYNTICIYHSITLTLFTKAAIFWTRRGGAVQYR